MPHISVDDPNFRLQSAEERGAIRRRRGAAKVNLVATAIVAPVLARAVRGVSEAIESARRPTA
jgi:hypothetical protein